MPFPTPHFESPIRLWLNCPPDLRLEACHEDWFFPS
jgi:hypothetical protein